MQVQEFRYLSPDIVRHFDEGVRKALAEEAARVAIKNRDAVCPEGGYDLSPALNRDKAIDEKRTNLLKPSYLAAQILRFLNIRKSV